METKRTTVYMDLDLYTWLAETAKRQRRSISSMNECLIDWHRRNNKELQQYTETKQEQELQHRLRSRRHKTLETAAKKLAEAAEGVLAGSTDYNDLVAEISLNPLLDPLREKEDETTEETKTDPFSELELLLSEIREQEEDNK